MVSIPDEYDYLFKLVLLGDRGAGKTSLILRYSEQIFDESQWSTLGVDFRIKTIKLGNQIFRLQIWNITSHYRIQNLPKVYLEGANGVIFVYDCTSEKSFENIKNWNDLTNNSSHKYLRKVIVGNKCDRRDKVIDKSKGEELAREINARFFETSAKEDININEVFEHITCEIKHCVDLIWDNVAF